MKTLKIRFNRIVIIGVGLIGGSIGLAVKKAGFAKEVVGLCRRKTSALKAIKAGAVDIATLNYDTALKGADLVIIATSVGQITDIARIVTQKSENKLLITDAGSTKEKIVNDIEKVVKNNKNVTFVGSHPMAGSEKTGVLYAAEDLFNDSICIITPTKNTDNKSVTKIKGFWHALGCKCKTIDPVTHDKLVCQISHIP
ncbi:MAG: prephenate dehydrogenase/arogenate dehydrogenase family protein, partial [Candidatus Omnitrophica bacterium]|nr:prephenate dehydrogenase/arogenate dehydrogenase family protein [Candidatus Omnitrophota bacterium]